ncbi:dipeptidase PepE [Hanstruepera flava]|uniref:dipeptidase PepE n=1 Tax=Hanstruepera flava TaxID=2930218 RepID=UPI002028C786|nr:dipeptidase PepE [Hanstruepera flava]
MKKIIIASTSTVYAGEYLDYLLTSLSELYQTTNEVLFIPYARPNGISHNDYTSKARDAFNKIDKHITGIHEYDNPIKAVKEAQGIFIGGGNTFVLVNQLYKNSILSELKESINNGTPYLGTSAGSNICGLTMNTTNDMPIVLPPSFKTLGLVPFNINPHYLDPIPNSKHMGETRETRIKEFHCFNTQPVVGLREGSWIDVNNNQFILKGEHTARVFEYNKLPYEVEPGYNFVNLK